MLESLCYPFMWLAAVGFIVSTAVHIGAYLGIDVVPKPWLLGYGIFAVWLPAGLVSGRLVKDFKRKDSVKAVLRGCPQWLRKGIPILFAYVIINFVIFMVGSLVSGRTQVYGAHSFAEIRGVTGHFLIFYAMAFAIFYSAIQVAKSDPTRRCPSGHPVPPAAKFCEQCGAEILSEAHTSK